MKRLLLILLLAIPAIAQTLSDPPDPILVPIWTSAPVNGAFGSSFTAGPTLWAYSEIPQRWLPSERGSELIQEARPLTVAGQAQFGGRLLYFDVPDRVTFSHRVTSLLNDVQMSRATVPIIRKDQFHDDTIVILDVPITTTSSRLKLTVFKVDGTPGEVDGLISYQPNGGVTGPADFTLAVNQREGTDQTYPYFATAPLSRGCIVILPHLLCSPWTAMVVVRPRVPGHYWAMVSETDNATQAITLRYPQ